MILYKHQQELVDRNPARHGLFFEVGTGKTLTAIRLAEKNTATALAICPKSIKQQWWDYLKEYGEMNDDITWQVVTKEEFRRDWNKLPRYECLIYDEFHNFGNHKSQLHKAAMAYSKKHNPPFIYGLTGTPYLSSILNLYAYERLLGHKPNLYHYYLKYFYQMRLGGRMIFKQRDGLEEEVSSICRRIGTVVKLQDAADVPEQVFETEYFDLTAEQKRAIAEVKETESNHIVKWTAIHQVCGGTKKGDGYTENKFIKCEKIARIKELAEQHKKLIIVCRYNLEVEMIAQAIGENVYKITGQTKDRHNTVKQAEAAETAYVIVNAACSEGYGLPSFPLMVFYSYDFSLKNYLQICGRIQRLGNIKKNVYLSLVVKDTIDEDVKKCIESKKEFDVAIYGK